MKYPPEFLCQGPLAAIKKGRLERVGSDAIGTYKSKPDCWTRVKQEKRLACDFPSVLSAINIRDAAASLMKAAAKCTLNQNVHHSI